MKRIWNDGSHGAEISAESCGPDYRVRAIGAIAELVTEALQIKWGEQRIVKYLLMSAIGSEIGDILEQYLHSQLEIIGKEINREFRIDERINSGHATHAKMNDFIKAIKGKYETDNGPQAKSL